MINILFSYLLFRRFEIWVYIISCELFINNDGVVYVVICYLRELKFESFFFYLPERSLDS